MEKHMVPNVINPAIVRKVMVPLLPDMQPSPTLPGETEVS
jgi:hypothetical protein